MTLVKQLALGVVVGVVLVAKGAHAGDAAAEALFRAGREASESGDFATACARFEESQRLEPAAGTAFNLGHCREQLGQVASAWMRYREARDRLAADDERVKIIDSRIAELEPRLPKLKLELAPGVSSAEILRDGVRVGRASLGLSLPLDPGQHEIVLRVPGHSERRIQFEIRESEQQEIQLEPGPARAPLESDPYAATTATPAAATSREHAGEHAGAKQRAWGLALGALGLAGLATSITTGAMVLAKKDTVANECFDTICSDEGMRAAESGRLFSNISTISFAVGVLGVGAGTYLILTAPDGKERARLDVRGLPHAASVALGGKF